MAAERTDGAYVIETTAPASEDQQGASQEPGGESEGWESLSPEEQAEAFRTYQNQKQFNQANTQRAQELADIRREVEQERQQSARERAESRREFLAALQQSRGSTALQTIPDPLDDKPGYERYMQSLEQRFGGLNQGLTELRARDQARGLEVAKFLNSQSLQRVRDKHPDMTDQELTEVARTAGQEFRASQTGDGHPYYPPETLEKAYNLFIGTRRVSEARQQGRQDVVQNAQQARAAQGVRGRRAQETGASLEERLIYYTQPEHRAEFLRLPPAEQSALLNAQE